MGRDRNYSFTINNYTPENFIELEQFYEKNCKFMIFGEEGQTEGKTPHYQGYLQMRNAKGFSAFKKSFIKGAHFEVSKGSDRQNIDYCSKEGKTFTYGTPKEQGKRNDLALVRDHLTNGGTLKELIVEDNKCSLQKIQYALKILPYVEPPRPIGPVDIIWNWGPTGCGKTYDCLSKHPDAFRPTTAKWWQGYDGNKVVLFDDFRTNWCEFAWMLVALDVNPFTVETKGGSRQIQYKTLYITSPWHPKDMFHTAEDVYQIVRRCTKIQHFSEAWDADI
jgi:hypothetical protein